MKYIGFLYSGLSGKAGHDFYQPDNENNRPFIPLTNIFKNTVIDKKNMGTIVVMPDENQNKVQANDLFLLMSSEDYEGLAKSAILLEDLGETYLIPMLIMNLSKG